MYVHYYSAIFSHYKGFSVFMTNQLKNSVHDLSFALNN